jgi:hypothetical protein
MCQFRSTRYSLVRITPLQRHHANILAFAGIFIFQIFYYYPLPTHVGSMLYTQNLLRIHNSRVGSNGIR